MDVKMRKWMSEFEVKCVERTLITNPFVATTKKSWGVFVKGREVRANDRWYGTRIDAERGAAQIFNKIEKSLLGKA